MSEPEVYEGKHLTLMFDGARCIHARQCVLGLPEVFRANVKGPWIDPDAAEADELRALARRCPSGAITYTPKDGTPPERAPKKNVFAVLENGPYAARADLHVAGQAPGVRAVLCRCGASKNKPYCDGSHGAAGFEATGEIPTAEAVATLETTEAPLRVTPLKNGPLKVEGPLEVTTGTGRTIQRGEKLFFCRCGASNKKPFCDGTHSKIGFEAE